MVIGKMYKSNIASLHLGHDLIHWCNNIRYLGVYIVSDKSVKYDFNPVKFLFSMQCYILQLS